MTAHRGYLFAAACLAAGWGVTAPAHGAGWPERAITVIVPYAAGGAGDVVMRLVGEEMDRSLGQKIVVVPRPGGAGNIGAQAVVGAAPDGYTLLLGAANNFVINQHILKRMNFDPQQAFTPITRIADVPAVIYSNPKVPAKTLTEFIAYAKSNPGKLNFGSPSFGTTPHLSVERLKLQAGIALVHVPFQGAPPAVQALIRNDIQLYVGGIVVGKGHIAAGTIRALAVSNEKRLPGLPDTPTIKESGIGDFGASNWWGFAGPSGMSKDIVDKLHGAVVKALAAEKVRQRFEQLGYAASGEPPAAFAALISRESEVWARTIKDGTIQKK